MRYYLLLSLSTLILTLGCQSTPTPQATESPQPKATVARKAAVKQVEATYDGGIVSDDIAKLDFTSPSGEAISVMLGDDNIESVKFDQAFLDDPDPDKLVNIKLDWIGEVVVLHYDEDGKIVEVSPKKK